MKAILFSAFFISASFANAATSIRFPVIIDIGKGVPVAKLNKKIVKAGGSELPEFVEVYSQKDASKKMDALAKKIETAMSLLKLENNGRLSELVPGENDRGVFKTCFTGDGNKLASLVSSLADYVYSDQLNIHGWKFGSKV